ncbi:4Fe-4S binding protein [Desulfitobacterium metallireducens]|uniref:4Fe-4S ferredoxin n=1 Tax=Desulfitobacterium metallireducens DSM 15288 TaxID=871968 RepID=W0EBM2_9FIRM|nr:4Fe-4S binding protein [Desulfitobacterium metallireducens]AHF06471.1 4Fe-4S ferredoxin [Desulfitobacterium metallireducens DSM 15288]
MKNSRWGVILSFLGTVILTLVLSLFVTQIFGGHSEKVSVPKTFSVSLDMTVSEISATNNLKLDTVKDALKIKEPANLSKTLAELNISEKDANEMITKKLNLEAEEATKNPALIGIKFIIWAVLMIYAFIALRRRKITPQFRKYMLLASFILTGVILGSEPNAMSTVKDFVSAYAIKGIIFPPRLVALIVFLLLVFVANKFTCGWACQFGSLQDFIFQIDRNSDKKKGVFRQYKVPFLVSNTIRILFFFLFVSIAFLWSLDIIEIINPFTIFNPTVLTGAGILFILFILVASLIIYRPWCHFFCPFGFVGWGIEKFSLYKIKVNHDTCIDCGECSKACPSMAMEAILKRHRVTPDCFSCGSCIIACPTKSVEFKK